MLLQRNLMSETVIKVENLSKQYRLGEIGTGTLTHDLNRWWHKIRGKENPYLKIGEENIRATKGKSDYVWALKDINFGVQQGEVLGIIGKNGAGKSTLLKILSRTTTPSTGSVKIKGRVASLLEVGTGFHPELSGRDNIYLNGAILGMTKLEIRSKFDEILDFAGVERFIDTPVKRYSSGMYVRLAFAVAAHLDPEILIVDEVLAVGDAEFQKKALGKMQQVSKGEGRTVIFVSHNMASIKNLCTRSILLTNGSVKFDGDVIDGINHYVTHEYPIEESNSFSLENSENRTGTGAVRFCSLQIENHIGEPVSTVLTGETVKLRFRLKKNSTTITKIDLGFSFHNEYGDTITALYSSYQGVYFDCCDSNTYFDIVCNIFDFPFSAGQLIVKGRIEIGGEEADWPADPLGRIFIENGDFFRTGNVDQKSRSPFLIKGLWGLKK